MSAEHASSRDGFGRSLRARVTAIAMAFTLVSLVLAAVALQMVVRRSLISEIDQTIANRALDVADGIDINNELNNAAFPTDGETFIGVLEVFDVDDGEVEFLLDVHNDLNPNADQVAGLIVGLGEGGELEFGEPAAAGLPSLDLIDGDEDLRVVAQEVSSGAEIVIVARSLLGVDRTTSQVLVFSLITVPLLTLLLGVLVWLLVGRALRPVEHMRAEVESIRATDLARRIGTNGQPRELHALGTTMNSMLERLETSQDRQRRFASDAAHELRSPLASMAAQLDVDAAHPESADLQLTAQRVRNETRRLQGIVSDLLLMARSAASDQRTHELLDLHDVLGAAVAGSARPDWIELSLPSDLAVQVRGQAAHLERLFTNVLNNAFRHSNRGVEISVVSSTGRVQVMIDDDGLGIRDRDRDRVFERFVRLDEARDRDGGGSGMGLALVREIATQHGGTVHIETAPLGGARFVVGLPAV